MGKRPLECGRRLTQMRYFVPMTPTLSANNDGLRVSAIQFFPMNLTTASTAVPARWTFTDEALALRFAERHADDLRYVAAWSKWMTWDGRRWQFDDTLRAFDLVRKICREAAAECKKRKVAAGLASAKTVAAVERLAKADRRLAATVDQWDADPWLLNTPRGVIDLRTGRPARAPPRRLLDADHGGHSPGRLSDMAPLSQSSYSWRQVSATILAASGGLLPHRHHDRARTVFQLWDWR